MKAFKAKKNKRPRDNEERTDPELESELTSTGLNSSFGDLGHTANDKHPRSDSTPVPNNIQLQTTDHITPSEATPTIPLASPTTTTTSAATPTIPLATPITPSRNSTCANSLTSLLGRHVTPDPYHTLPALRRNLYGCPSMVKRLSLERRLKEHEGCVNCINFSWGGQMLASGSDDLQVVLWDWARGKVLSKFDSNHVANVFQVS